MVFPLVSVITPVLNRADTMRVCLGSVASQSYPHVEHIVVDGGSTDGTVDVIRACASDRLRWISEPDHGMYDAINKGMAIANGEILAYLNSDDLYLPWTVSVAVEHLNSSTDLVFGDLGVVHREEHGKLDGFYVQFYPQFNLQFHTYVGTLGQPTVFWRCGLSDLIGPFDRSYRLIGDCEYWLRAAKAGASLRHIDEVMAIQVEHSATLRATQAAQLGAEFERLRSSMSSVTARPRSERYEQMKQSLLWRKQTLEFCAAMRSPSPRKWPRFVGQLRARGVAIGLGDAMGQLLPRRWRTDWQLIPSGGDLSFFSDGGW
jgi:hypothetical protein